MLFRSVLISDTGARVVAVAGWEYLENGVISSVTPSLGQEQSEVQIAGARLLGGGSSASVVTLAGLSATIRSSSATVVEVYAARSPVATVGAVVIVADTGAIVTLADGWQYLEPGDITSVSPSSGQEGTEVTIDGSKLLASGTVASRVTLLGIAATVVRSNGTQVVVTAAASTSTEVVVGDVTIISDTGVLVTEVNGFTYHPNGFIENLEPTAGVLGSSVFIYGQQLRGYGQSVATVTLDGVAATIVQETNFFVTVTAGSGVAGAAGDVVLTANTGAVITKAAAWTFVDAGVITEVSPSQGIAGTTVTIRGSNLNPGFDTVLKASQIGRASCRERV